MPPAPGLKPPSRWGTRDWLEQQFGPRATDIHIETKAFMFRYRSPEHWLEVFRSWYGPIHKAFLALDALGQQKLERDIIDLVNSFNRPNSKAVVLPSEYLEVVITKAK